MDFIVSKKDLSRAVSLAAEFVSNNKTTPILSNLFIETVPAGMLISATDFDRAIQCRTDVSEVKATGSALVPASGLRDFLGGAPGAVVRFRKTQASVIIESGKSKVTFRIPGGAEFPQTPLSDSGITEVFQIPSGDLPSLFSKTSFVSKAGENTAMEQGSVNLYGSCGVRLIVGDSVTTCAHDGKRVSRVIIGLPVSPRSAWECTVPPRASAWLSSSHWDKDAAVIVSRVSGGIILAAPGMSVFFRATNFPLPDMSKHFSPEFQYRAIFNTDDFKRALASVNHFSTVSIGDKFDVRRVLIELRGNKEAAMRAGSEADLTQAEDVIWCSHDAPEGTSPVFDPAFLMDFCKITSEKFEMKFSDPAGIFRLTHKGDKSFVYLVQACSR